MNLVHVRVKTEQKRERVERTAKGFSISVREKAERNLANTRARELLARTLRIAHSRVRLASGHHSPSKTFAIRD